MTPDNRPQEHPMSEHDPWQALDELAAHFLNAVESMNATENAVDLAPTPGERGRLSLRATAEIDGMLALRGELKRQVLELTGHDRGAFLPRNHLIVIGAEDDECDSVVVYRLTDVFGYGARATA